MVRPRFPENVGMLARACANMGVADLRLVAPRGYDPDKAAPLATVHARHILDAARFFDTLAEALADVHAAYGTTARTGGWRQGLLTPDKAGVEVRERLADGQSAALVLGPEDKGLTNDETRICTRLVTIPTAGELSSLNVAQAGMVLLYECFRAGLSAPAASAPSEERFITHAEHETLLAAMQEALLAIDFLKPDNPDYWLLPMRRFLARTRLKRHEFNQLMGVCRQALWAVNKKK
jgi:tRNA/rRNA methyltransferase